MCTGNPKVMLRTEQCVIAEKQKHHSSPKKRNKLNCGVFIEWNAIQQLNKSVELLIAWINIKYKMFSKKKAN